MLLKKKNHGFSAPDVDHREFRLKGIITEEVSFDHEPSFVVGWGEPANLLVIVTMPSWLLQLSAVMAFKI